MPVIQQIFRTVTLPVPKYSVSILPHSLRSPSQDKPIRDEMTRGEGKGRSVFHPRSEIDWFVRIREISTTLMEREGYSFQNGSRWGVVGGGWRNWFFQRWNGGGGVDIGRIRFPKVRKAGKLKIKAWVTTRPADLIESFLSLLGQAMTSWDNPTK